MNFKLLIILFILILSSALSKGQHYVELTVNPHISWTSDYYKENRFPIGSGCGLNYSFKPTTHIGIKSGISYSLTRISASLHCRLWDGQPHWQMPTINIYNIIEIPLLVTYDFNFGSGRQHKFMLIAGYGFGRIIKEKINLGDPVLYETCNLLPNNHFAVIGVNYQKRMSESFNLTIGPYYEHNFQKKGNLLSIVGIRIGADYRIR